MPSFNSILKSKEWISQFVVANGLLAVELCSQYSTSNWNMKRARTLSLWFYHKPGAVTIIPHLAHI